VDHSGSGKSGKDEPPDDSPDPAATPPTSGKG
jgi:hypothetical protein